MEMLEYYLPFGPEIELGQQFGWNPFLGPNPAGGHNGDDWLTPIGTPVYAAGDGEVVFAGEFDDTYADNFGWNLNFGGTMVVLNMDGERAPYFEYGHLLRVFVKAGDRVTGGQVIALTGNSDGGTGVSTGAHCHVGCLPYNFNLNTNTYGRIHPRAMMTKYYEGPVQVAGEIIETKEDTLSKDTPMISKDGAQVTLEILLNSIDAKVDGLPKFDRQVREDLEIKGKQITAMQSTIDTLVNLIGKEQGLEVDAIKSAVSLAIAEGLSFNLTVEANE